jgi:hypothetical protein
MKMIFSTAKMKILGDCCHLLPQSSSSDSTIESKTKKLHCSLLLIFSLKNQLQFFVVVDAQHFIP